MKGLFFGLVLMLVAVAVMAQSGGDSLVAKMGTIVVRKPSNLPDILVDGIEMDGRFDLNAYVRYVSGTSTNPVSNATVSVKGLNVSGTTDFVGIALLSFDSVARDGLATMDSITVLVSYKGELKDSLTNTFSGIMATGLRFVIEMPPSNSSGKRGFKFFAFDLKTIVMPWKLFENTKMHDRREARKASKKSVLSQVGD